MSGEEHPTGQAPEVLAAPAPPALGSPAKKRRTATVLEAEKAKLA